MNISLWGWYGKSNYGDDVMLENTYNYLFNKFPNSRIILYGSKENINSILSNNDTIVYKRNIINWIKSCLTSDVFIWNGGTGLPHKNNIKILFLIILSVIMKIRKKSFIYLGFGVSEKILNNKFSFMLLKKMISSSALFTCRQLNMYSIKELRNIKSFYFTADLFFSSISDINKKKPFDYITFSLASVSSKINREFEKNFINELLLTIQSIINNGYKVQIISCCQKDNIINRKIASQLNIRFIPYSNDPQIIYNNILNSKIVFGMRYHAVLTAIKCIVPVCSISYSEKGQDLMNQFGLSNYSIKYGCNRKEYTGLIKNIEHRELLSCFYDILNNYENIISLISKLLPEVFYRSMNNYNLLFNSIKEMENEK